MLRRIRVEVSLLELAYITEALEQFVEATPEDHEEYHALEQLHDRIEKLYLRAQGE